MAPNVCFVKHFTSSSAKFVKNYIYNYDDLKIVTISVGDMYNLEQLRMFVEAVEQGSFSACARKLGKVQSAVSQGIGNLEVDFDVQLFDRSTRKPTLTSEGERLYKHAKVIVMQTEELDLAVQSIGNAEEGVIRLAFDDLFLTSDFAELLNRFSRLFPATDIELISTVSTNVVPLIRNERADIGLMLSQFCFDQDMALCTIGYVPIIAVCHPDHPLAKTSEVQEMDLMVHRQIMLKGDDNQPLEQFPVQPAKALWVNSFSLIKPLLHEYTQGWAFMPKHLVAEDIAGGSLSKIDVIFDHKEWCPPVELITAKGQSKGAAQLWLEEHLKELLD